MSELHDVLVPDAETDPDVWIGPVVPQCSGPIILLPAVADLLLDLFPRGGRCLSDSALYHSALVTVYLRHELHHNRYQW